MDVSVELTAVDIVKEIFGDGKIAEIEAIVPERQNWSVWTLFGWAWLHNLLVGIDLYIQAISTTYDRMY